MFIFNPSLFVKYKHFVKQIILNKVIKRIAQSYSEL